MHNVIRMLRNEHRSLTAVLNGLEHLARAALAPSVRPRFAVFRAMLHYIDQFPERLHHPKEESHLFPLLEKRAPEAAPLIEALRAEHAEGARRVRELERLLAEFEVSWPRGTRAFAAATREYAEFHWKHMLREEQELMPLSERALVAEDWRAIEEAFVANEDPIADLREQDFASLYTRIVSLAPAPVGLGERWEKPAD